MDLFEKSARLLHSVRLITWIYLIIFLSGLSASIYLFDYFKLSMQREVDIEQINIDGVKEDVNYKGNIYYILDCFAVEADYVQFGNSGGYSHLKDTNRYYIIPVGNNNFMAYKASDYFEEQNNELIGHTWSAILEEEDSKTASVKDFKGVAVRMNSREYDLFLEWFRDTNFLDTIYGDGFEGKLIPYYLVERSSAGIQILFISSVMLSIAMLFCLITSTINRALMRKSVFTLIQNGQEIKVNSMNDIVYAIMSLDDTDTKELQCNIYPDVSDISIINVKASPDICNYVFEYNLNNDLANGYKKMETSNIKVVIEQFRRIYEDGRKPKGCK